MFNILTTAGLLDSIVNVNTDLKSTQHVLGDNSTIYKNLQEKQTLLRK